MNKWLGLTVTCAVLGVAADVEAAKIPPAPDNPMRAQTSLGYSTRKTCPELRIVDEGNAAVIVFWVPGSGIPAQVSIKSSSGSSELDAAALSCVARLRFAPATRMGDGESVDAWQQVAMRYVEHGNVNGGAAAPAVSPAAAASQSSAGAGQASAAAAEAPVGTAGGATSGRRDSPGVASDSVTVHVCVDAKGKLKGDPTVVRSSGKASLDQAAVGIAASGSAYYRPDTSSGGPPVSGCAQLVIKFETADR